jgi:hypothetical protein
MGRKRQGETTFQEIDYDPLPSQKAFHNSRARMKGFSGPIGSGKSQALCHEAIKLSYLNPGRSGLIGAPTYPMLRDATQQALFEILNSNGIPYEHLKAENILVMRDTGSRILFRPLDDYERLRGTNLAWFGLDEMTYAPEGAWLRLEGRLRDARAKRLCGFGVWTPKGFDWVYRRFIADPKPGYEVIRAQPFENRFLLEQVPDFYERLKGSYDEKFFLQEARGEYLHLSAGLVYHAFDRALHVAEVEVDGGLPLLWALDFNVDPMSSVVAQMAGDVVRVVDEIVLRNALTEEACAAFWERFGGHPVVIYGDASGNSSQTTGSSDYEIIREFFRERGGRVEFRVPKANPLVRERVNLVNARLKSASGEVRLVAHPRCKELIKDFEQVTYKEDTYLIDKDKDRSRTHLSDALGYLIWQERKPQMVGERGERLL